MDGLCLYKNDSERAEHCRAIHRLAEELCMPEERIRCMYEEILSGIRAGAKIKDFLVVLVCHKVKDLTEKQRNR